MKPAVLTAIALTAFAFNSILCRLALGAEAIDAASFTSIRLVSGAITLLLIGVLAGGRKNLKPEVGGNWISALFLFAYAVCFSFAYQGLSTATGALILFGVVQITMIAVSIVDGERPRLFDWLGLVVAFGGLVYLVSPGLESPPVLSSVLMSIAGVSWGFYSLRGKGSKRPVSDTTGNFLRAAPMALVVSAVYLGSADISKFGILMAITSGAAASGIGYAVWYSALKFHSSARAAILQLAVPLIAALGGIVIVFEPVSARLPVAAILILGGILATIAAKEKSIVVVEPEC